MRLTDHTDYSLRVLMYLNQQRRLVTLSELSKKIGVSRNNLIKVSNQLAKLKFIETSRGRAGGIAIKSGTENLSLKQIVSKTEGTFYLAECFSGAKCECILLSACALKGTLTDALRAFMDALGQRTLNDVTPHGKFEPH